jgi:hypothetical protein
MAIVQISRIQHRRGLQQDLPQLASGELGWSVDTRRLFIGNGTVEEGAPELGRTEILTTRTDLLSLVNTYTFKGLSATGFPVQTGPTPNAPVVRTLQDKLDDVVSVKDFGALGNGVADDTDAINRALSRAFGSSQGIFPLNQHRTITFPAGLYRVTDTINIPPYTRIQGEGKNTTIIQSDGLDPKFNTYTDEVTASDSDSGYITISDTSLIVEGQRVLFTETAPGDNFTDLELNYPYFVERVISGTELLLARSDAYTVYPATGTGSGLVATFAPRPVTRFVDGANNWGVYFGDNNEDIAEYHLNDISIVAASATFNQSCLQVDGAFTAVFNRINFKGNTPEVYPNVEDPYEGYNTDKGTGIACVAANNISYFVPIRNMVFHQCDFQNHNYGIELNSQVVGCALNACYIDSVYHGVVAGNSLVEDFADFDDIHFSGNPDGLPDYIPTGVSVYDTYFRFTAAEGVKGFPYVNNIMSLANIFTACGLDDWEADNPINNPEGLAMTPGISFNDHNNFSIADSFDRDDLDYARYPNIETNGYDCYVVGQDVGLLNGRETLGTGYTTELSDSPSYSSAGLRYYPRVQSGNTQVVSFTNLRVDYTVSHAEQTKTGTIRVANVGGTFAWDEEYVQTGETGVIFQANTTTGDIEYTSTESGNAAVMSYSLKFFKT